MILFIIGVSGTGKTTVGRLLASVLNLPFFDADDFHPAANIEKMSNGIPLNDDDRAGWLTSLHAKALDCTDTGGGVFACSALKKTYRTTLAKGIENQTQFFLLKGDYELIMNRLQKRKGHYMPPALLQSQFDILEVTDEVIEVDIQLEVPKIIDFITTKVSHL